VPSLVYDSMPDDMARGDIAFDTVDIRVMLVTSGYVADKAAHTRRSDITGEVSGTAYSPGGEPVAVTVTTDTVASRTDIALGGADWPASTITAAGAVYYVSRLGLPNNDELIAYIDFGGDIVSISGLFQLQPSTVRISNP
jgi:hypothetical protein